MKVSNSAERIREILDLYNIKQAEFARRTNIHKATVSAYVKGNRIPAQDNIFLIANAFGVDPAWVMGYDVPMRKNAELLEKYNKENAESLIAINGDKRLMAIVRNFQKLTDAQKTSVESLIESMVNH